MQVRIPRLEVPSLSLIFILSLALSFPLLGNAANDCLRMFPTPPCHGQEGRCTLNSDNSPGGFVANTAHIESTLKRNRWNKQIVNIPKLGVQATVCDRGQVTGRDTKVFGKITQDGQVRNGGIVSLESTVGEGGVVDGIILGHTTVTNHLVHSGELLRNNGDVLMSKLKALSSGTAGDNEEEKTNLLLIFLAELSESRDTQKVDEFVRTLEQFGYLSPEKINTPFLLGSTPLTWIYNFRPGDSTIYDCLEYLLSLGADPFLEDSEGLTALEIAYQKDDYLFYSILLDRGLLLPKQFEEVYPQTAEAAPSSSTRRSILLKKWLSWLKGIQEAKDTLQIVQIMREARQSLEIEPRIQTPDTWIHQRVYKILQKFEVKIHNQIEAMSIASADSKRYTADRSSLVNGSAAQTEQTDCPICLEPKPLKSLRLAEGCLCKFCKKCHLGTITEWVSEVSSSRLKCPGCDEALDLPKVGRRTTYLGIDQNAWERRIRQEARRIQERTPGWTECPTPDCLGGKVLTPSESAHFHCKICHWKGCLNCKKSHTDAVNCSRGVDIEKENYLMSVQLATALEKGRLRAPDIQVADPENSHYLDGKYRPCFICGKMTEKISGCNHMHCHLLPKDDPASDWDWVTGHYSGTPNFESKERNYELPAGITAHW